MEVTKTGFSATYDGTWSGTDDIVGAHDMHSVSCTSSTFCVAVDDQGNAYQYDGGGWSSAQSIDGSHSLNSVSCSSSSFCVAVDNNGSALTFTGS